MNDEVCGWALRAQVAASMMGAALPAGTCAARLMLFVGGPSTEGAGKVVDKELSEPIRSHEVRAGRACTGFLRVAGLTNGRFLAYWRMRAWCWCMSLGQSIQLHW